MISRDMEFAEGGKPAAGKGDRLFTGCGTRTGFLKNVKLKSPGSYSRL